MIRGVFPLDYRAVKKLAADPDAVKAEAALLRQRLSDRLTTSQERFLANLEHTGVLNSRFWEAFYDLKARASLKVFVGGYRAYDLLEKVYQARFDLNDEDAERFVEQMLTYGREVALSEAQWKYLFALCRKLYLIEVEYIPFE